MLEMMSRSDFPEKKKFSLSYEPQAYGTPLRGWARSDRSSLRNVYTKQIWGKIRQMYQPKNFLSLISLKVSTNFFRSIFDHGSFQREKVKHFFKHNFGKKINGRTWRKTQKYV